MTKTLDEFRATFTPAQRGTIDARAAALIAEEMTLSDLWRARELTQDRDLPKLRRRRGKGMGAMAGGTERFPSEIGKGRLEDL